MVLGVLVALVLVSVASGNGSGYEATLTVDGGKRRHRAHFGARAKLVAARAGRARRAARRLRLAPGRLGRGGRGAAGADHRDRRARGNRRGARDVPLRATLLNDPSISVSLIPVWAFLGGMFYAVAVYWLGGGLLFGAARRLGGLGSYRRARHLLALSVAPLALSLFTVWPLRIVIYGENLFRTGGTDWGPGDRIFGGVLYFAFAWSAVLLVVGVRAVHGWSWGRASRRSG